MSLNACQQYLQGQLDGLTSPNLPPCQAWVLPPPTTQPAEYPQIYVWGGDLTEDRATLPRPLGQKRISHTTTLWVQWMSPNDTDTVQNFPLLIDSIRAKIRGLNLAVQIVDPTTGDVSQLTDIGERIMVQYSTPVATADQRYLQNNATIRLPYHEWINPD